MAPADLARQRILAWVIDFLIVTGVSILVGRLAWLAGAAYILLRDGLFEGQSLGKRILGLKVVAHQATAPCTYVDSAVRNVLWVIPIVNFVMGLTGLHYLMHDPKGRHWGDRLANTEVVPAR